MSSVANHVRYRPAIRTNGVCCVRTGSSRGRACARRCDLRTVVRVPLILGAAAYTTNLAPPRVGLRWARGAAALAARVRLLALLCGATRVSVGTSCNNNNI